LTPDQTTSITRFHDRVKVACWDGLIGELVMLHQPHLRDDPDGQPRCHGCDRDRSASDTQDTIWLCRTYTIIAASVLMNPTLRRR
jgi:hypothetical protein